MSSEAGFAAAVQIRCLATGCNHEASSIEEHNQHLATADHADEGEACK